MNRGKTRAHPDLREKRPSLIEYRSSILTCYVNKNNKHDLSSKRRWPSQVNNRRAKNYGHLTEKRGGENIPKSVYLIFHGTGNLQQVFLPGGHVGGSAHLLISGPEPRATRWEKASPPPNEMLHREFDLCFQKLKTRLHTLLFRGFCTHYHNLKKF